jgi:hypothetical protein
MVEAIAEQRQKPLSLNASLSPLSVEQVIYGQSAGSAMVGLGRERSTSMTIVKAPMTSSNLRPPRGGLANSGVTIAPERRGKPPLHAGGLRDFSVWKPIQSQ